MSGCRLLFLIAITIALLSESLTYAGPARSLGLAAARSASKIPRSIRAPFRNTEMMTARGFGKRSQLVKVKDGEIPSWSFGKRETQFLHEINGGSESIDDMFNGQIGDSFPIDWLANEMSLNPQLARAILERFVDINKDNEISGRELLTIPTLENNDGY